MIRRVALIGGIATVLIAVSIYAWLGGFRNERIERVSLGTRIVTGTLYQGAYGDLELRKIFVTTQQRLEESAGAGTLVVINYDSLADTKEIDQLIGILGEQASGSINLEQTVDTLAAGNYLRVHLYGHPVVRSTPAQINNVVRRYAADYQLELMPLAVEHYFGSDSMWVEYPVGAD